VKKDAKIGEKLLSWYDGNKRDLPWRKTKDPYRIWVAEVMLQQTQVATVIPYYERFLARFPDVAALARAAEDEVLSLWKGLGYYARARNLWRGAQYVMTELNGTIPHDLAVLRKIPGVGEYTAGAIASIAFGVKAAAIDGNVKRVLARLLGYAQPVESAAAQSLFRDHLDAWQPADAPGDFNQALMDLGAMVCTPKAPRCPSCPLQEECEAYRLKAVLNFPVKRRKSGTQAVTRLTFVLCCRGKVYLQKRPSQGLLANMWEFPGVELQAEDLGHSGDAGWKELRNLTPERWIAYYERAVYDRAFDREAAAVIKSGLKPAGPLCYAFSHRRWQIYWVLIDLDAGKKDLEDGETPYGVRHDDCSAECFGNRDGVQVLRERPLAERDARWVAIDRLDQETLPVAFREIVDSLKTLTSLENPRRA